MSHGLASMDRVLAPGALEVVFQPIVECEGVGDGFRVRSVESLVRGPKGTNLESAEILFDYVRRKREEVRTDRACVSAILAEAQGLPPGLDISINVHSATIARDPEFVGFLLDQARSRKVGPERLIIEIVEHASESAGQELTEGLNAIRRAGMHIALDDVGQGQSNFRMIVDCQPDYFKIDGHFVRGVRADPYRQAVLQSVVFLAKKVGARVVAEGIEERVDLDMAMSLGVSLFQGFLFSRAVPSIEIAGEDWSGECLQACG